MSIKKTDKMIFAYKKYESLDRIITKNSKKR
jgi:hypothetical protein